MLRFPAMALRAAAIVIPALLATSVAIPARAQIGVTISYDNFHSRLAPYGTWSHNPRWGEVWRPRVASGFRPYYNGHWEDTREYGWLWISEDSWGDVPYHYGRWVSDPRDGWLWVPGYVWGPSWVVWRSGGGNIGWFPMPPGDDYYGEGAYRGNFDNQYGYRDWYGPSFGNDQFLSLWIFVGEDHFRDRNFRNYAVPQRDYGRFFSQTRDSTNYITINNYIVNRSVDSGRLQRVTNQNFQPVPAANVIGRSALVTQATAGRQVEQRERRQHPIPANINPNEARGIGNTNPAVQQPDTNRGQQNPVERGNGRDAGSNGAAQPNPQPDRAMPPAPAADTSRQNDRGQPNVNPPEQQGRGNATVQQPSAGQTPQGGARNGNNRAPNANAPAQPSPQSERVVPSVQTPQTRNAPARNEKTVVQEAPAAPRAQRNAPAAAQGEAPGNGRANQAQGDKQSDTKAPDDKNNNDKKQGNGRGPN